MSVKQVGKIMSYVGMDLLFATQVAKYSRPDLNKAITKMYNSYDKDETAWDYNQTHNCNVLDKNKVLQKEFVSMVKDFVCEKLSYSCDLQMTTSWFTKTFENDYHANVHTHHNSWWSGVYYMQDDCALQLLPSTTSSVFMCEQKEFNLASSAAPVYKPNAGELLIFPSNTPHVVIKKEEDIKFDGVRHTLAFNIMPKGKLGVHDSVFSYK